MAIYAMTATQVVFNSQDHTSKCKSASLELAAEQLDTTNMSSAGWVELIGGLYQSGELMPLYLAFPDLKDVLAQFSP